MYKIAVMGDYESIYGFASLGIETFPVTLPKDASKLLNKLVENEFGIIYITEVLTNEILEDINKFKESPIPAIITIPGTYGNTGIGVENIKKSVEQAVGSDILFGDE